MIANIEPIAAGFCLTDPADPRYQYVAKLRRRFGECLHKASLVLRQQGEENTLYAVLMLVSHVLLVVPFEPTGCSGFCYPNIYARLWRPRMVCPPLTSIRSALYCCSTYEERDKLSSQVGAQRRYEGQQVWPREIFVARARLFFRFPLL